MDALGAPRSVEESRRLGAAAVRAVLRVAGGCRGAVIDSTWYPYAAPLARALPGSIVEVRCRGEAFPCHLDDRRTDDELWGSEVLPLGLGPLLEVDTTGPVDVPALADQVHRLVAVPRKEEGQEPAGS